VFGCPYENYYKISDLLTCESFVMAAVNTAKSVRKDRWSLSQGQSELLTQWMSGAAGLRLARRAWFILSEQEGLAVHRYFQATPVPSRRIQAIVQRFDQLGPFGLIERSRSGRPSLSTESWTARRTAAGEHWTLVRNLALDGGRKRRRTLSLKMPRYRSSAPILALTLDHEVLIVVTQTQAKLRVDLPMVGQCLTMGENALASQGEMGALMDWRAYLLDLASPECQQLGERVSIEQRKPFVGILKRLLSATTGVRLHFIGSAASARLVSWMAVFGEYFDSVDHRALLRAATFSSAPSSLRPGLDEYFDAELSDALEGMLQGAKSTLYWVRQVEVT